jgi:hypothetical protein
LAVKYVDNENEDSIGQHRDYFIACILPIVASNETDDNRIKYDRDLRILGRHHFLLKGYYVITPLTVASEYSASSITELNDSELDNLCGHESDLFVAFFPSEDKNLLGVAIYSKKEKRFVLDNRVSKDNPASNSMVAGGFISGGLIGAGISAIFSSIWGDTSVSEKMVGTTLKDLTDLKMEVPTKFFY